jgi:catechol 2,3-dioxygenase-like lactoylglutathione lyase family enzyme
VVDGCCVTGPARPLDLADVAVVGEHGLSGDPERSREFYEALGFEYRREFPIVRDGELEATNYFFGTRSGPYGTISLSATPRPFRESRGIGKWNEPLAVLYRAARRSALNADEVVDALIEALP